MIQRTQLCLLICNNAVYQSGDSYAVGVTIAAAQGISFQASQFEVLPTLKITTGAATTLVSVMY